LSAKALAAAEARPAGVGGAPSDFIL
jgi:hypothetical protein